MSEVTLTLSQIANYASLKYAMETCRDQGVTKVNFPALADTGERTYTVPSNGSYIKLPPQVNFNGWTIIGVNQKNQKWPLFSLEKFSTDRRTDFHLTKTDVDKGDYVKCPELRLWTDTPTTFIMSYSYSTNGLYFTWQGYPTEHTFIGTRRIDAEEETCGLIPRTSDGQGQTVNNPENTIITLHGENHLPIILPLYIQNTYLKGTHHLITKDVLCGSNLIESSDDDPDLAVFKNGSDYNIEKNGTFKFTKNVKIEKVAKLKVIDSNVTY